MTLKKVVIGVFSALVIGVVYFASLGIRTTRIEDLRSLTEQNVPLGATPEMVYRFLDAQHLEHSELMRQEMMHISGHDYANKSIVLAIKRRTHSTLLVREDIQLVFVFDDNKKLKAIDLVPIYTGP